MPRGDEPGVYIHISDPIEYFYNTPTTWFIFKKKEARTQGSYSALVFRRSSGPELVTWQILVNGFASRARLSRTLPPPYTFGSMSVRWNNGIHLLSQVLSGTLNAVV